MLERIHQVKGIGLLHEADASSLRLKKASLIYADNGRGKSTLASIFRSCSINKPDLLLNRRTINGVNDPEVVLQFANNQRSVLQNRRWNQSRPELLVFDEDFVEKNMYAGGEVTADQRRNLLQFALGETAVAAQREYDQADHNAKNTAADVRAINNRISLVCRGLTLLQFQAITEVPDADYKIAILNEKIVEAHSISLIQARSLPEQLVPPDFDIEAFFNILSTSLSDIDLAAEEQVKIHLNSHNKPNLEKWVSDGYDHGVEETCLFCNQSLEGVQLIRAYQSYFNQDYSQLKSSVAQLDNLASKNSSDAIFDRLKDKFSTARAAVESWQEQVDITPLVFDEAAGRNALKDIRDLLEGLKQAKEARLLDEVGSEEEKVEVLDKWQILLDIINDCNQSIVSAVKLITAYKENLAAISVEDLQRQISDLEWSKIRHGQDVMCHFIDLAQAQSRDSIAKIEKQTKKDALNQIMQTTLASYKDRINELLRGFGAQFTIPNINFNYRGGLSSDYVLQMRGSNIALSGGSPDFKTSLSEGDKRTLAFSFFIASAESDPDLANKVIVIDDPMCSLDLNRKQQTRTVLKRLHDCCEQLIIMAHDVHFLRHLRNDILRTAQPSEVRSMRLKSVANRYSNFDDINLDQECESAYFKCHRTLSDYVNGHSTASMAAARSIRPMLEGYLHRRFPGEINSGLLFGGVINAIQSARHPSPLVYAQNITDELNEINRYSGQFHHDTNPSADQVEIIDSELLAFVERATNLVYAGVI